MARTLSSTTTALAAAATLVLLFAPGMEARAGEATGVWKRPSGSSQIQIAPCGSSLCGKIVWLRDPRNDTKNPDASKHGRPLLGTQTVIGMKPSGDNRWKGKVYNAEDGKTYSGVMTLVGDNGLKLEGCVLGGLICKGETWTRVR